MASGLKPVRLSDVPLEVRYAAARKLAKRTGDPKEILSLLAAAAKPTSRVYWVKQR